MYNSQKVFNANILVYALLFVFMIPLQSNAQEISANTLSCNFTIGDFVWNDTNANGIQDSGEPGIQNVLVLLYRGNGTKLTQTTTNSSGYYYFDAGVYGYGDYKVKFILPSGYTFSPKDRGDYDKDSDADETTGETIVFSCNNDGDYFTVDAGMYKNSIIGDFVWNDADKDGKQDYNESGISGVEVKIYKSNGTYVGSANTNDAGYYKFENLSENDYYLQFVLKSGYAFSPQDQGDNSYDSDANTSTGETATTHLSAGEIDPTWDAGMYVDNAPQLASVGDFVWYDGDENGMQNTDGSSVGVDNVNVELFNSGGGSEGTTQTNSNGWYSFTDLTPGDYYLKFSNLPNGYVFTAKDQGSDASIDSDVNPANGQTDVFNLVAGENDMKKDAGIYETANIIPPSDPTCDENTSLLWENNIVINDCNVSFDVRFVNGQTTQYTIPTPYPSAFNGSVDITISEAIAWDGYCDRPGTGDQPNERFRVVFKKGGSVVWSSPYTGGTNDGIDTGVISDEWVGPLGTTVNLPNGADEIILVHWSNDAYGEGDHSNANSVVPSSVCIGYETVTPELGSIGNWVWHDTYHYPASGPPNNDHDVDGIQDSGELGIEGVLVELRQGNSVIYTKTTDATGFYEFTNLPAGDYVVRVANSNFATGGILEGWYAAPQNRGGNDALDSDGNNLETQPFEQPVNLSEGEHDPTVDFGFFFTCVDLIKTGPTSVKVGETVTYHFRYENCGDIVHHGGAFVYDPMINPYGDHEIWNGVVWPGQVVEFDKTYTTTEDDCGELENCAWAIGHTVPPYKYTPNLPWDRDDDCWKLKVLCCEIEIGDYVWWDENHNGEQDDDTLFPGNAPHGINDVRVILYDGSGNYLDETITTNGPSGGTGWYEFIDLLPGDYIVKVDPNTVPGDLIYQTFDYDGIDTQHEAKVTLVDCETNYDLDFGYDDEPLPVTLASFTANSSNGEVILTWVTESEIENQGFILERRTEGNGDWLEIANFTTYPELKGQGTVTYSTTYNFIDRLVQRGQSYEYRLGDVDYDGVVEYHATRIVEVDETSLSTVPNQFAVKPAYPNPFNPSTVIEYAIPEEGKVNITIYDLMGQKISTLRNETQTSGWHQVRWNGQDDHGVSMPAGVYLISVNAGNSIKTMKLIFVK